MLFTFKISDVVIQGVAFLTALVLLLTKGAFGYFYWISLGIIAWDIISVFVNFLIFRPLSTIRIVGSGVLIFTSLVFGIAYLAGISVERLNFYYQNLSIFLILGYFILCLMELNKVKNRSKIDLNF